MAETNTKETGSRGVTVKMSTLTEGIGIVFSGVLTMLESLDAGTAKTLVEGFVNGNGETANTAANTAEGFTDAVPGSTAVSGVDDSTKKDSASGASQPVKAEQTKQPEKAAQTAQHSQANSGLTVDEVAKIVVQKVKANPGINEKIRALVIAHGAQRVTELKPENLEAFLTDLSQL